MVKILPENANLGEINETVNWSITFGHEFPVDPDYTYALVSLKVTVHDENKGIIVDGATISGAYRDSFGLGADPLKYIINGEIKVAQGFDELPRNPKADLFYFRAPSVLKQIYSYTVQLVYTKTKVMQPPTGGGETEKQPTAPQPEPVTLTEEKVYTKTVLGSWDTWAQQLRQYVRG